MARLRPVHRSVLNFRLWLSTAKPGSQFRYYEGYLAADRVRVMTLNGKEYYVPVDFIDTLAKEALAASDAGKVHLMQYKLGDMDYEYIAVRAS
jgi:hypothetical protein